MKLKVAKTCGECPSFRQFFAGRYICNMESLIPENAYIDISSFEVKTDSKPEWCRMDKLNKQLSDIDENNEIAIKGMAALFGANDIFEEDDAKELVKIVRCKDCKYSEPWPCQRTNKEDSVLCTRCDSMKYKNWFCADGRKL
ncbi:MAG: hypothetical protein IJ828_01300 [Treponema sp.]|nr:hypothetical protein [Treponema sp.]